MAFAECFRPFNMSVLIRVATQNDLELLTTLIRYAFRDVAERFQLTPDNCPKHPSNCAPEWIAAALAKGVRYYILAQNQTPCGCVALESAKPGLGYLERLAVLPQYRHQGLGEALVAHVCAEASQIGIRRLEIGIIAAQTDLQAWYAKLGFVHIRTAEFPHLPFKVAFMAKDL
jgi:ribosomal protein S18 acetylase RimI-like enzyme